MSVVLRLGEIFGAIVAAGAVVRGIVGSIRWALDVRCLLHDMVACLGRLLEQSVDHEHRLELLEGGRRRSSSTTKEATRHGTS